MAKQNDKLNNDGKIANLFFDDEKILRKIKNFNKKILQKKIQASLPCFLFNFSVASPRRLFLFLIADTTFHFLIDERGNQRRMCNLPTETPSACQITMRVSQIITLFALIQLSNF
jgi:hypothetical protein